MFGYKQNKMMKIKFYINYEECKLKIYYPCLQKIHCFILTMRNVNEQEHILYNLPNLFYINYEECKF